MIDQVAARNEIFAFFKDGWEADGGSIVGYIPNVEWQGVQPRNVPDTSKHWARISIQTVGEHQASLSVSEGANGQRRYNTFGLVFIQLFSPRSEKDNFQKCLSLAQIGKKIFRGKTTVNKIWFKNVRINELGPEDSFNRLNVVAEFEYDELG